jgi:hypothetical protein
MGTHLIAHPQSKGDHMPEVNLTTILQGEQPKVLEAMRVALAALQDGNTVDPEALTHQFLRALALHGSWVAARDGKDVHG